MKNVLRPLCALLLVISAQGVRAEVDSKSVYESLTVLRKVVLNDKIDRKGLSYSPEAITKSVNRRDLRVKVAGNMIELASELTQEEAEKNSNSASPFKSLFEDVVYFLKQVASSPDENPDTRVEAIKLLGALELYYECAGDSLYDVSQRLGGNDTEIENALKIAMTTLSKQSKVIYYNTNDGGRGKVRLKK
jgi:hypothetical protein